MLEHEIRFECLKLAATEVNLGAAEVIVLAGSYADFVLGTVAEPVQGKAQHPLYGEVAEFLAETKQGRHAFGMAVANNPNLVAQLQRGAKPQPRSISAVRAQMEHYRQHGSFMPRTPRRPVLQAAE